MVAIKFSESQAILLLSAASMPVDAKIFNVSLNEPSGSVGSSGLTAGV